MKKVIFFFGIIIPMLLISPAFAQVAQSPFNYFLGVQDSGNRIIIPGESREQRHQNWIDVLSFRVGVTQSGTMAFGGGGGAGKPVFQDLTIFKRIDRASVILNKYCATGQHIPQVVFSCALKGGMQQEIYNIKLSDVLVSVARVSGDNVGAVEEFSFIYSKIEWLYSTLGTDGKPLQPVKGGYDVKLNKGL